MTIIQTCLMRISNFSKNGETLHQHHKDVIMGAMASQNINLTIVNSTIYSGANQRIHQSSASLAFMRGIHRWPVNSPHKGPVTRKVFPFDNVIMGNRNNDVWQQAIHEPMLCLSASFTGTQYRDCVMMREIFIKRMHLKLSSAKWRQLF